MRTKRIVGLFVIVSMLLTTSVVFAAWKGWRGSGSGGCYCKGDSKVKDYSPGSM